MRTGIGGRGEKCVLKLNINVQKDLNLTLNEQVYNRNYNAYVEETCFCRVITGLLMRLY